MSKPKRAAVAAVGWLAKAQHEIVLIGGVLITGGEIAAGALPASPAKTYVQVALPVLVTVVQRARTVPVAALESVVERTAKKK